MKTEGAYQMSMKYLAAAAIAASMVAAPASAAVCIGVAVNGGAITNVGCDAGSGTVAYNATTGGYTYSVSGQAFPLLAQPTLLTNSLNIENAGGANSVIDVYVTQTDLNTYNSGLMSAFTTNTITGATATISSYLDAANGLFTGGLLQSAGFTSGPTVFTGSNLVSAAGPFSETVKYSLNFTGGAGSNFNGTANLTAVPEPATWAMMLIGFGALGFAMRRRRAPVMAQLA